MTGAGSFKTAVGISGIWVGAPDLWSFSTLAEVSACPRRYALRRASYPEIWDRPGYPERVNEAALLGTAVHDGVELVLRELSRTGCSSIADEQAVAAIRRLGGYSKIATRCLDEHLQRLSANPRMAPRLDGLRAQIDNRASEMRRGIQALVSQSPAAPNKPERGRRQDGDPVKRATLGEGRHLETTLVAEEARFAGRLDLLVVHSDRADIMDFKTGQPSERHNLQLHLYGLLWQLDETANARRLPVGSLVLGYVDGAVEVEPPSDWGELHDWLRDEIANAESQVRAQSPAATPSVECWHCPVRQLCDEYWDSPFTGGVPDSSFVDREVSILSRNGPTSWLGRLTRDGSEVLLRSSRDCEALALGSDVRILNLLAGEAEELDGMILTMTRSSEVFGPIQR
ncbi:PD-(D/E)XK nuclease family protein [Candidatus Poriferisodalis multihospitum]|uniref:RecB family exonuclease n=1 Tax=Candidatus Poriferisodalis multihospitum TaxID=2983191 RepID=UPI002B25D453|nr:PD-(D/E)XK nuclease family protein [Candidatus Poriferisodalis multihospitum]